MNEKWLEKNNIRQSSIICVICLFPLAFLFILINSYTTSILNPYLFWDDSAFFQSMGSLWAKGQIPYRDVFDHKGPLLHLINRIAYMTDFPRLSLMLIQSLMATVAFYELFMLLKESIDNSRYRILVFTSTIAFWGFIFESGNLTEEYSIPFLMIVFHRELIWILKERDDAHPISYAFIDGICFGMISMIIVKNALPMCILLMCIILILIRKKQYKNLLANLISGIAGVVVSVMPFVIYFFVQDALKEFIFSTIIFNFAYLNSSSSTIRGLSFKECVFLIPEFMAVAAAVICILRKNYNNAILAITVSIPTALFLLSGNRYKHYFMIGVPLIALAGIVVHSERSDNSVILRRVYTVLEMLIILLFALHLPRVLSTYTGTQIAAAKRHYDSLVEVYESVPQNERDELTVFNTTFGQCGIFAVNRELRTNYSHPFITSFHNGFDPTILPGFMEYCMNEEPKWIAMEEVGGEIQSYINTHYELVKRIHTELDVAMGSEDTYMSLYRRTEKP